MNEHSMYMSEGMEHGEETPVVMSSRIRLARNLDNHVHPLMFTSDIEGQKVINEVQDALPDMQTLQLSDMEQTDKLKLVAKHLISSELIKQPASAVLLNEDESLSIMVNEEDHIRIQAMSTDMNLASLFEKASEVDDELDRKLSISFDETLGYLTTCPTNIGTGMRASVMLHLPRLSITKRMNRIAQTINRFGFTIRGIYGEGSQVYGHVFQVSNQLTLGRTEEQIIETLIEIVQQIITEELNVRKQLHQHSSVEMEDRIYRSLGLLRYGRLMSLEEAAMRLSEVKLGIDLGYIELSDFNFNEMMVAIQSPFLINETDEISINEQRANVIREHIN